MSLVSVSIFITLLISDICRNESENFLDSETSHSMYAWEKQ